MDERIPLLGGQRNSRNLSPHPHAYPQVCPAVDQVNQQQNRRWGMSSLEEDHGGVDKHPKRLAMFRRWNDDEVAGFFYDVLETQFLDDAQQRLFTAHKHLQVTLRLRRTADSKSWQAA